MNCPRCAQPITAGQLYITVKQCLGVGGTIHPADPTLAIHAYPCPTLIRPPERYAEPSQPTCCGGGPQWGHAWECPKAI